MNLEYKSQIPSGFSMSSKVWIYQCSRLLVLSEAFEMEDKINQFVSNWLSHGKKVEVRGYLFFGQFLVFIADESFAEISGCSIDSSVHFIKDMETHFGVNFFDRQSLAFVVKDKIEVLPFSQVSYALKNEFLSPDTLFFNNLIKTKEEFLNNWIQPLKNSWLGKRELV